MSLHKQDDRMGCKVRNFLSILGLLLLAHPVEAAEQSFVERLTRLEERCIESGSIEIVQGEGSRRLDDNDTCADPDALRGILKGQINFSVPFTEKPRILLCIDEFDLQVGGMNGPKGLPDTLRLRIELLKVEKEYFEFCFVTWCNTIVHSARAFWLAHSQP